VVVHYTAKGSEKTAEETDYIGKDGLKAAEGTVIRIDRGGKLLTLKTAKGGEETFRLSDYVAEDAGKDIEKVGGKSGKVTVYMKLLRSFTIYLGGSKRAGSGKRERARNKEKRT